VADAQQVASTGTSRTASSATSAPPDDQDAARNAVRKINEELSRGECVCFPVYDKAGKQPVAWYFVGNTSDWPAGWFFKIRTAALPSPSLTGLNTADRVLTRVHFHPSNPCPPRRVGGATLRAWLLPLTASRIA